MISTKNQDSGISVSQQAYSKHHREKPTMKGHSSNQNGGKKKKQQTVRINKNFVSSGQLTSVESVIKILNLVEMSESM